MRATSETVENNKVKLSIVVDEADIETALTSVVKTLGHQVRIPGFRPGKVPRKVLEARMGGAGALRSEALRESLPDFYAEAVISTEIDPIAQPEIDITEGEESGPVTFEAIVEVRPEVSVAGYNGLTATIPSLEVSETDIDAQIDRMRDSDGELVDVDRAILSGDYVTLDLTGTDEDGETVAQADDYLYQVGSGTILAELDDALPGARSGQELTVTGTPEGGAPVTFAVSIKDVKEKVLPEVTDEWAAEASEFATVAELRADLIERMSQVRIVQGQMALREAALSSLIELIDDAEIPEVMVDAEVQERLHDLGHRLEAQKLSIEQFLQATGQTGDDLVGALRAEAVRAVKVDLGLRAVVLAEAMEVTEEQLAEEIGRMAEQYGQTPAAIREQLDRAGRTIEVKHALGKSAAATWLVENINVVDEEGKVIDRSLLTTNVADEEAIEAAEEAEEEEAE